MMTRSSKLALSLVLAVGAAVPALAQDNFPDVPANHWAFEALVKLKADGVLVGYPDGLFRGSRPASRYELAVALNAAYTHLKSLIDGTQTQLDALKAANAQDIQNLKDQIAHLQDEINAMKGYGDDIAALKRLSEEFHRELTRLGVDVDKIMKDLGDLQERVTKLEHRKPPIDISGDVDFFAVSTNRGSNGTIGLTTDGGVEGKSTTGLLKDLSFLHEGAFTVAGTNEKGPKWHGTFVAGNVLGQGGFGNQSTLGDGGSGFFEGKEDVYVQELSIKTDVDVIGQTFGAEAGRVGYKLSPYVFSRPATESYFDNERWSDGKYRFDGAILGFKLGGVAKLNVFGGNTANLQSVDGVDLNPVIVANTRTAFGTRQTSSPTHLLSTEGIGPDSPGYTSDTSGHAGTIDQMAGADLGLNFAGSGHLSLSYLALQQNGVNKVGNGPQYDNLLGDGTANRDQVFGADATIGHGRFKLSGGIHDSLIGQNGNVINSRNSEAWNVEGKYAADKFNIYGGFRTIDKDYFAPGDWGRIGFIQNPANIEGWQAGGSVDLGKVIRLTAEGEWDKGLGSALSSSQGGLASSSFDSSTNLRQLMARVDLKVTSNLSLYSSFQDVKIDGIQGGTSFLGATGAGAGAATSALIDWTTVGLGYGLSSTAKFSLAYQFSNGGDNGVGDRINGGILTSQLSIKF